MRKPSALRPLILSPLLLLLLTSCDISVTVGNPPTPPTPPPPFAALQPTSVSMLSPQEGWAVGVGPATGDHTDALHYQHGTWTRVPIAPNAAFSHVVMLSATDGWAVGGDGIFHYDGTHWGEVLADPGNAYGYPLWALQDIAMVSPTEGWAVGEGGILHDTGGEWLNVTAALPPRPATLSPAVPYPGLHSVFLLSATDGWAVGDGGTIWHYDGKGWRPTLSPDLIAYLTTYFPKYVPDAFGIALYGIWMVSPTDGWAVGGTMDRKGVAPAVIEHFRDGTWTVADILPSKGPEGPGGVRALRTLVMVSPTEGWAAGAHFQSHLPQGPGDANPPPIYTQTSYLLHYLNGQWTEVAVPNVGTINGIAMDAPNDGWAAADGGLLHYHDGTWTAVLK